MIPNSEQGLSSKQKKSLKKIIFKDNLLSKKGDTELRSNTFIIIDAAKDEGIPYYLDGFDAEYACLLNSDESKKLGSVAPYLVRLDPEQKVTDWFVNKLFGQGIGFIFQTKQSLEAMRVHWKNQVRSKIPESNEKGFFRFYDPKVLTAYLPILDNKNEDEVDRFTKDCEIIIVEGDDSSYVKSFWKENEDDDTLSSEEIWLDTDNNSIEDEFNSKSATQEVA